MMIGSRIRVNKCHHRYARVPTFDLKEIGRLFLLIVTESSLGFHSISQKLGM